MGLVGGWTLGKQAAPCSFYLACISQVSQAMLQALREGHLGSEAIGARTHGGDSDKEEAEVGSCGESGCNHGLHA